MAITPQRSYRKQMLSWHILIIVVAWNSLSVDGKLELRWGEFCVCLSVCRAVQFCKIEKTFEIGVIIARVW